MKKPTKKTVSLLALFICLALVRPHSGTAGSITDDLKTSIDKVIAIMQDPALAAAEKKSEQDKLIHNAVKEKFDWEEISKRALGVHWRDLSPAQQKQFVEIFDDFLERTYISKVSLFLKETKNFSSKNIVYLKETIDGQYALIDSKIPLADEEIPISYKLINKDGKWVVYDLTIEGVGIVANYRTQFNELLTNGSFETLIEKLKTKQGEAIIGKASAPGEPKKP
jgi:phospholipid transport system substrate-binding protein